MVVARLEDILAILVTLTGYSRVKLFRLFNSVIALGQIEARDKVGKVRLLLRQISADTYRLEILNYDALRRFHYEFQATRNWKRHIHGATTRSKVRQELRAKRKEEKKNGESN